uniref:Uncharacterized protein n=1 Tax=Panagrolaimus davidi TaxID=227884 RepID=A0A914Q3M8_9BILA
MYLHYLLIFVFQVIQGCNGCMATPQSSAAPEVPVIPCQTCAAPGLLDVPAAAKPTYFMGPGSVAPGAPVTAAQCVSFVITCNAVTTPNNKVIQIGVDQIIGQALAGPSMAGRSLTVTVVCNGDGVLEGVDVVTGNRVTLTNAYCSVAN